MLKCNLNQEKLEYLKGMMLETNEISVLQHYASASLTPERADVLREHGLVNNAGELKEDIRSSLNVLSQPYAVVKYMFTGGVGKYVHSISYDKTFQNHVAVTETPDAITLNEDMDPGSIVRILEDFTGRSTLKSVNVSYKLKVAEALVIAAIIDMERKTTLRAFVDEIVVMQNTYTANMIWRIINSTSDSIQWFVYLINEVVGEHSPLTLKEVQEAMDHLVEKNIATKQGEQYKLCEDFNLLANRMVIVDNVVSVQMLKVENASVVSSGFTSVQTGVHDLLMLDYDGEDLMMETISSARLAEYLKRCNDCEEYFKEMIA